MEEYNKKMFAAAAQDSKKHPADPNERDGDRFKKRRIVVGNVNNEGILIVPAAADGSAGAASSSLAPSNGTNETASSGKQVSMSSMSLSGTEDDNNNGNTGSKHHVSNAAAAAAAPIPPKIHFAVSESFLEEIAAAAAAEDDEVRHIPISEARLQQGTAEATNQQDEPIRHIAISETQFTTSTADNTAISLPPVATGADKEEVRHIDIREPQTAAGENATKGATIPIHSYSDSTAPFSTATTMSTSFTNSDETPTVTAESGVMHHFDFDQQSSTTESYMKMKQTPTRPISRRLYLLFGSLAMVAVAAALFGPLIRQKAPRHYTHIIPPAHYYETSGGLSQTMLFANLTLRDVLTNSQGFHLAMAPAFFGFYGYFGMLAAWEEHVDDSLLRDASKLRSVAGASAGAMAAVLIAAGVAPRRAADFCANMTLSQFADPPGMMAAFKGDKFEQIMNDFLRQESPAHSLLLEEGVIPVGVSGFDLQTMSGKILRRGSMARAARASATFPFLFQPVQWKDDELGDGAILIDGGIADSAGLLGLNGVKDDHFVINLVVGAPLEMKVFNNADAGSDSGATYITLSMKNLPNCGPWAMANGLTAVDAASKAMQAALDIPLYIGRDDNHLALQVDASSFWK